MKRILDVGIVLLLAPLWIPLTIAIAVLVRLRLGGPVLFTQVRPGRHGRPFRLVKFRTMTDARDGSGALRPDSERMPPFGHWLRGSSLDELPELWNVLCGEMSLVGPRPLLMEYMPLYSEEQARRHEVRPGITGWAQVNGRNAIGWDERFLLDVWYVDHQTWLLDVKIMFSTVALVVKRHGISAPGEVTMSKFTGPRS
jgi:lipopolysaccharide/colanic/teichoic acid biosynthesis glycosyltransferase